MRILLAEKSSFSPRGIQELNSIAPTDACDLRQEELAERVSDYEALVVRLGLRVDAEVLSAGRRLLAIGTPTTGLDHIDLAAARKQDVAVLSLKGERLFLDQVYATAEHSFALLLSLARRIPAAFSAVQSGEWRRDLYRGWELNGKTLGLIGCGRLGNMVVRYAQAFGMQVLVYDPYIDQVPTGVTRCSSLMELLSASDMVSVHVPLNAETEGLLGEAELAQMRPGAFLVNTSRGAVLDENVLLQALESGRLGGAALDVLYDEHLLQIDHPLLAYARQHDNLIITPHIGGATYESVEKADLFLVNKLRQFLQKT